MNSDIATEITAFRAPVNLPINFESTLKIGVPVPSSLEGAQIRANQTLVRETNYPLEPTFQHIVSNKQRQSKKIQVELIQQRISEK